MNTNISKTLKSPIWTLITSGFIVFLICSIVAGFLIWITATNTGYGLVWLDKSAWNVDLKLDGAAFASYVAFVFTTAVSFAGAWVAINIAKIATEAQSESLRLETLIRQDERRRQFNEELGPVPQDLHIMASEVVECHKLSLRLYQAMQREVGKALSIGDTEKQEILHYDPFIRLASRVDIRVLEEHINAFKRSMAKIAAFLDVLSRSAVAQHAFFNCNDNSNQNRSPLLAAFGPILSSSLDVRTHSLAKLSQLYQNASEKHTDADMLKFYFLSLNFQYESSKADNSHLRNLGLNNELAATAFLGANLLTEKTVSSTKKPLLINIGLLIFIDFFNSIPTKRCLQDAVTHTLFGKKQRVANDGEPEKVPSNEILDIANEQGISIPYEHSALKSIAKGYEKIQLAEQVDERLQIFPANYRLLMNKLFESLHRNVPENSTLVSIPALSEPEELREVVLRLAKIENNKEAQLEFEYLQSVIIAKAASPRIYKRQLELISNLFIDDDFIKATKLVSSVALQIIEDLKNDARRVNFNETDACDIATLIEDILVHGAAGEHKSFSVCMIEIRAWLIRYGLFIYGDNVMRYQTSRNINFSDLKVRMRCVLAFAEKIFQDASDNLNINGCNELLDVLLDVHSCAEKAIEAEGRSNDRFIDLKSLNNDVIFWINTIRHQDPAYATEMIETVMSTINKFRELGIDANFAELTACIEECYEALRRLRRYKPSLIKYTSQVKPVVEICISQSLHHLEAPADDRVKLSLHILAAIAEILSIDYGIQDESKGHNVRNFLTALEEFNLLKESADATPDKTIDDIYELKTLIWQSETSRSVMHILLENPEFYGLTHQEEIKNLLGGNLLYELKLKSRFVAAHHARK